MRLGGRFLYPRARGARPACVASCLFAAALTLGGCAWPAGPGSIESATAAPLLDVDFADPFILPHDGGLFAYATNTAHGQVNVQMAWSSNLTDWRQLRDAGEPSRLHDAMPTLPPWAKRGFTWAPEVLEAADGFVLYFTARHAQSGLQCVGAATAADPRGPFVSTSEEPLVCQYKLGGTIDASPFRDADGQLYLYYKNDGNNPDFDRPTEIFAQRLASDGLRLLGEPVSLVRNDQAWEGRVVEAPTMARNGPAYTLLFSANDYGWRDDQPASLYAIGHASCEGPLGPCTDAPGNPLLASRAGSTGCLSGPGHQAVFEHDGASFIAFHAWAATADCRRGEPKRSMHIARLTWRGGDPEIGSGLAPTAHR